MISVVILTKNEEKNILDCLESVSWADEIVVVDDYSEDRTTEVIKQLSAVNKIKIFKNHLENNFAKQRNFGLSKTTKEWVLFIDADERITKELREEINTILVEEKNAKRNMGFYIPRKDVIWGKLLKHGETAKIKLLRLARRDAGAWSGIVHEEWIVDGNIGNLTSYLLHYPHQTISEFLKEINFYTTLRAKELHIKGIRSSIRDIISYPSAKFLLNYFIRLGFLDGVEGLVLAIFMSFHSFLVRAKLWLLWKKS